MKSKIWLDFDDANNPLLRIKHTFSSVNENDLKDKFLNRFITTLNKKYKSDDDLVESCTPSPNLPFGVGLLSIIERGSHHSQTEDEYEYEIYPIQPYSAEITDRDHKNKPYVINYDFDALYRKVKILNNEAKTLFSAEIDNTGKQIEASEVLSHLENGYKVSLGDYQLMKVKNVDLSKLKNNSKTESSFFSKEVSESINDYLDLLKPIKKEYDDQTLKRIAEIHASNFISVGVINIIEIDSTILNEVIKILAEKYSIYSNNYAVIQDNGITTLKKIKIDNVIPFNINDKFLSKTGRSTRLVDAYVQKLFEGEQVVVKDHNGEISKSLFATLYERLKSEHGIWGEGEYIGINHSNDEGFYYAVCDGKTCTMLLKNKF